MSSLVKTGAGPVGSLIAAVGHGEPARAEL